MKLLWKALQLLIVAAAMVVLIVQAGLQLIGERPSGTIVLIADAPVSEVEIRIEGASQIRNVHQSGREDRIFMWDFVPTSAEPRIEVTWVSADGRRHAGVDHLFYHSKLRRCVHVIRADARGDPEVVRPSADPQFRTHVETRCRITPTPWSFS